MTQQARPHTAGTGSLPEAIEACTLTPAQARVQSQRHEQVGRSATGVAYDGDAVRIDFDATLDRAALDELIEVERECCPFFTLAYDEDARALTVSVEDAFFRPALEHLAQRLGAGAQP